MTAIGAKRTLDFASAASISDSVYALEARRGKSRRCTMLLACVLATALSGCDDPLSPPVREVVLQPRESIQATNKYGSVSITYVSPLKRKFEWDEHSRTVALISRPERWLGELGLYDAAGCYFIIIPLCRTPRIVAEEALHDFDSYDQLYAFVNQYADMMDWVYTSDGLLVGFGRSPEREQINVEVRQLTVKGKKPSALRGARNSDIRLIRLP